MAWLMGRGPAWAGLLIALPGAALAQDAPGVSPTLDLPDVVVTAPLAGSETDRAKVPTHTGSCAGRT